MSFLFIRVEQVRNKNSVSGLSTCIPASSAAVKRQLSGAGIVINERRTALDPDQVNNILFIRSMENMKLAR
jgi:hypothetical protein